MTSSRDNRQAVARLLKESIVQLCRSNVSFSGGGRVEVDGIICISGQVEGQELVVKVHEVLCDGAVEQKTSFHSAFEHPGHIFNSDSFPGYLGSSRLTGNGDDGNVEVKRRRLDAAIGTLASMPPPPLPLHPSASHPPSALYNYLSQFSFDSLSRRINAAAASGFPLSTDVESRLPDQDIARKSAVSPRQSDDMPRGRRSTSPSVHARTFRTPSSPPDEASNASDATPRPESYTNGDDLRTVTTRSNQKSIGGGGSGGTPLIDRWSPSRSHQLLVPQCITCGFHFDSADALGDHNESVHSIFTCLCCFKTFTSRSNLERHSRLHTGHRPYACPVCGKTFSRKDHLSNHATKHAYKCAACSRRCTDRAALAEHYRLEHAGAVLAAVCAQCNKGFGSVDAYEEHLKIHPQLSGSSSGSDQVPRYVDDANLPLSMSMTSSSSFSRQCDVQQMEQSADNNGGAIQQQHQLDSAPHFQLPFRDRFDMPTPMLHNDIKLYNCTVCRLACSSLLELKQHEILHVYELSRAVLQNSLASAGRISSSKTSLPVADVFMESTKAALHRDQSRLQQQLSCHHCTLKFSSYAELAYHLEELAANGSTQSPADELLAPHHHHHHRDKRKQKQPKPLAQNLSENGDGEDEEASGLVPAGNARKFPEREAAVEGETSNGESADQLESHSSLRDTAAGEIKMEPIRSIMNRSGKSRERHRPEQGLREHSSDVGMAPKQSIANNKENSEANSAEWPDGETSGTMNGENSMAELSNSRDDETGRCSSGENMAHTPALHDSTEDVLISNNNNDAGSGGKNSGGGGSGSSMWMESPGFAAVIGGPQRCVVCGLECADFADLETHCITEHSRSPCMFCTKTFAQKANRDRHVCLHTGDRPYGCPECGERFSRGDKLKMHRVRMHGVLYPLYGPRGGGGAHRGNRSSTSPLSLTCAGELSNADASGGNFDVDYSSGTRARDFQSPSVGSDVRNGSSEHWRSAVTDWMDGRPHLDPIRPWNMVSSALLSHFPKIEVVTDDEARSAVANGP